MCYCEERKQNPKLAKEMASIPPGYCGLCDLCGEPGHMQAHPHLPTTGAWCDTHLEMLLEGRRFNVFRLLWWVLCFITAALIVWRLF